MKIGNVYIPDQIKSPDSSMSAVLGRYQIKKEPEKSEDRANDRRSYWIEITRKWLGINKKTGELFTFKELNGMISDWSWQKIEERYLYATKHARNGHAYWWWAWKEDKKKK